MALFAKKQIDDIKDEVDDMDKNIGTMQDDLAQVISKKNSGRIMTSKWRQRDGRTKQIQRDLAQVYTDDDGQVPDLTRLEKEMRPWWQSLLYFLVGIFAVLFIVATVGFFIFTNLNGDSFTNERVTFKIEPPISVVSGQEQTYTIIIANNEKVNLYNIHIELDYPDNFTYVSGTQESIGDKKNIWEIGVLKIGESKEIKFKGKILATLNSVSNLSGVMTFKPENINADFNQKLSLDLGINSSVVIALIDGPEKILASQPVEYTIKLNNIGAEELAGLELVLEYPQGFVYESASIDPNDGANNIWTIKKLAPTIEGAVSSTETKIVIKGNYSNIVDSGNQEFKLKVTGRPANAVDPLLYAEQSLVTNVIKSQLSLSLVVNGSGEDQGVGFGDLLFYTLTYKNTGQDELKNIELTAYLNSEVLNWESLIDQNKGIKKGSSVTWTGKQVSKLLSLRPGDEGEITWQITVKDVEGLNIASIDNYSIESYIEAIVKNKDGSMDTIKSKTLTNSINSDLRMDAGARYYNSDNVPLGSGPIQPKSDQASSFNIHLRLSNNLHDVGVIEVSAVLPKNVNWDSKENHDTGDLTYNKTTRKITWKISKLSKTAKGAEADFNVSITPQDSDIGRVLILVPEVKLTGVDMATGVAINKSAKAITTSFNDPILGQVSGIVE